MNYKSNIDLTIQNVAQCQFQLASLLRIFMAEESCVIPDADRPEKVRMA